MLRVTSLWPDPVQQTFIVPLTGCLAGLILEEFLDPLPSGWAGRAGRTAGETMGGRGTRQHVSH